MSAKPHLGAIQETLLIPLYGRANDARRKNSILHDTTAAEMVDSLDYDFDQHDTRNTTGSVWRASIFDQFVRDFLTDHPDGTVVDLGCGLSTRSDRLDNGTAHWIDLDVADSIALRRNFFDDSDRYTMIAGSIFDTEWYDRIPREQPTLLLSEAVLLYFPEDQVHSALRSISTDFPGAHLAFDTAGKAMFEAQDKTKVYDSLSARFHWQCDDPATLQQFGLRLTSSYSFGTPPPTVTRTWPALHRYGIKLVGRFPMSKSYRFTLFECTPAR